MDISETYIKMCECAKVIQKQWKQLIGDFSVSPEFRKDVTVITSLSESAVGKPDPNEIWLPRQDQLQEMMQNTTSELIHEFYWFCVGEARDSDRYMEFISDGDPEKINKMSMEQLWLAFCQKTLYNKVWDSEKEEWEKIND